MQMHSYAGAEQACDVGKRAEMKVERPQTTEKAPMRKTRLNLNLSEKARAELDQLSGASGVSITHIVRFGLQLAKLYFELGDGETLGVCNKEDRLIKVVTPPW